MDPTEITQAIIGFNLASTAAKEVAKKATGDAYTKIKDLVLKRFTPQDKIPQAIAELENNPESKARQAVLAEEFEASDVNWGQELLGLAKALIEKLGEAGPVQVNKIENSHAFIIGNGGQVNYNGKG